MMNAATMNDELKNCQWSVVSGPLLVVERRRVVCGKQRTTDNGRRAAFSFRVPRSALRVFFVVCLLILFIAEGTRAAALADYRLRVHNAAIQLESLPQWEKVENAATHAEREAATVAEVRRSLPVSETVEFKGESVRVDNSWLDEAFKAYQELPADDPRRKDALAGIAQKLRALEERLKELEEGKTAGAGASKAENQKQVDGILRRDEYQKKTEEGGALSRLWDRLWNWFRDLWPKQNPLKPGQTSFISAVAQIIVFAIAAAAIFYVLWKLGPRFLRDREKRKSKKREARIVLGERLAPDQTSADLLAEAEALARSGDLRAAIRKGYIALLCELGDRKVLSLAQHKTNRDYLRDVSRTAPLFKEMHALTNIFESHWYGDAPTTENDWTNFRAGYQQAIKQG